MAYDDDDRSRDAYALFRPRDRAALEKYLEPTGFHHARKVGEDAYEVDTHFSFGAFVDGWGVEELFSTKSEPETVLHDDPRGLLVFPSSVVTVGDTYEAVVAEVGERGEWIELEGQDAGDDEDAEVAQTAADGGASGGDPGEASGGDPGEAESGDPGLDAILGGLDRVFGDGGD